MTEIVAIFVILYTYLLLFSIFIAYTERNNILNLTQFILLSILFGAVSLEALSIMLNISLEKFLLPTAYITLFLISILENLKILNYLNTKKTQNNSIEFSKTFTKVLTLLSIISLIVANILGGFEKTSIMTILVFNTVAMISLTLVLKFINKTSYIKVIETLSILLPILVTSIILLPIQTQELMNSFLPMAIIPMLYSLTSTISPFSSNQIQKFKTNVIFTNILTVNIPPIYLLITSIIHSSKEAIIITTILLIIISVIVNYVIYKSITSNTKERISNFLKFFTKEIKKEDLSNITLGSIIEKIHLVIKNFIGHNEIDVLTFDTHSKTLKILLKVDGDSGYIENQKEIKLENEGIINTLKSNKFFWKDKKDLENIFHETQGDLLVPITYEYDLKFVLSIKLDDTINYNEILEMFFSEIFHIVILETQAIITKNIQKESQYNALIFIKDLNIRQEITTALIIENYNVFSVNNLQEAIKLIDKVNVDLVICDNEIDEKSGINLIKQIKSDPLKGNIYTIIGFYHLDEYSSKEFLESLADLQILLKDDFIYINDTVSYITHNIINKKKIESTFKSITSLSNYSTIILNKILGYKTKSLEDIEIEILSRILSQPNINLPSFIIVGKINHTFIQSKILTTISNREIILVDTGNIPLDFYSRKKFGKNKTIWADSSVEGLSPSEFTKFFSKEIISITSPIFNFLAISTEDTAIIGINYLSKISSWDIDMTKSLLANYLLIKAVYEEVREVDNAFIYTMQSLARAAEEMDEETGMHIYRVGEYSKLISHYLGFSEEFCNSIYYASQMHDIGKLKIPREILRKPGQLTPEEFEIMKEHTIAGAIILGDHQKLIMARDIALMHHEKWDGSGYPYGLQKDSISISARIVAIADTYDALRSPRTYKPEFPHEKVIEIITKGDGRTKPEHFDPDILQAFKELHHKFEEIYEKYKE